MHLNDASMAIRPRSAWQALDLGILLARRHAGLLMLSWAVFTLPVFAVISLLLWQYPTLSVLLFWWLKPLFERLPLFILSRALFGDTPTLSKSLKALPQIMRSQWLASLSWRRFSLSRSFDLPVLQLEGLSGSDRRQRLTVLNQRNARAATWLTLVGMHLEMVLWLGALALMYFLIPSQLLADWRWQDLLGMDSDWLWFEHLSNLLYALALVIWEPIYVACGFNLYLNRRTVLEAWDIELVFRRLQERLKPLLPALMLAMGLWLAAPSNEILAAPLQGEPVQASRTASGPTTERLINQALTGKAASERIGELLDQSPFRNSETVTRWRLGDEAEHEAGWLARLIEQLLNGNTLEGHFDSVATVVEILLWSALFVLILWMLWRYRVWLKLYAVSSTRRGPKHQPPSPKVLFGLDVQPDSLPADVIGEVQRLWSDQPREAVGLLYRAFLSQLLHDQQLTSTDAYTEGEILELLRQHPQSQLLQYAEMLTGHWLNVAYGHRTLTDEAQLELCNGWRKLFASGDQV